MLKKQFLGLARLGIKRYAEYVLASPITHISTPLFLIALEISPYFGSIERNSLELKKGRLESRQNKDNMDFFYSLDS